MAATAQLALGPSPALQQRTLAARRKRMATVTTAVRLGKPCHCGERFYTVTYKGRKAIKAACYTNGHSADVPKARDASWFRDKLARQSKRTRRAQ